MERAAYEKMKAIQTATLAARKRCPAPDKTILGVSVNRGCFRAELITLTRPTIVTPLTDYLPLDAAVSFLDGLTPADLDAA